ncbi:MAG: PD40 domain-containing protein [Lewinellaceae bacterium]|nr:PD40 domain-containing protein [Lewinellaceae bacterium]
MKAILNMSLFFMTACLSLLSAQDNPLWLRYPAISPDGKTIVFTYKGDLYRAPSEGGLAYPLTLHDAYDHMPVWSHDGKYIAYASDRYGNFDVFLMPAEGGPSERLTYHSAGDYPSDFSADDSQVFFTSARLDAAANQQFPSGVLPELYQVSVKGGMPRLILTTPAQNTRVRPDGGLLIFHDRKGYEDEFRKHHTSSVTRDIWAYNTKDQSYRQLTDFAGEDRNPVFAPGEQAIYYLSEASGDFNIFRMPLDKPAEPQQLTTFEKHPVRYLSASNDGLLCFSYNGELYTTREGENPKKVDIRIFAGDRYNDEQTAKVKGDITEMALSPNGKELVFVHRGEVFVASVAEGTTRRITNTPEQERSISFSPDGRSILYAGERDGSWNVYQSTIKRKEEPYFFNATLIEEQPVVATAAEEFQPAYSPDGKEVAYLEERTILKVANLESKAVRTIMGAEHNYSYSDGDQYYQWSPDGKWFLVQYLQPKQWTDQAGLVSATGDGEIINLSKSGYGASRPRWMMEGKMVVWFSNRDGKLNHSGRGGEADAYALFLTQEAYDRFTLNEEEYKLLKEKEEDQKKEDKNGDKKKEEDKKVEPVKMELQGIEDRKARLTIHSSQLADAYVTRNGEKMFYLTQFEKGYDLWQTDLKSKETKILAKLGSKEPSEFIVDKEEKNIFVLADGGIQKVEIESGKSKPIGVSGEMVLQETAERAYLFEHAWRQVDKKFYQTSLHKVDWDFYKQAYARFLPHINNDYDFADLLSEMLGELNASHTGARYRPKNENGDQTAALGLFYDETYTGKGLKVAEVMDKSPVVQEGSRIKAGVIIEQIDGQEITPEVNPFRLLNRKADKNTLLSLYEPATQQRWEETVKPISLGEENELRYQRWVEHCREIVDKSSDGRIGYVHVRSMNDDSYRTVYEEVLGRNANKEALVVDTRFNGGGWLHDQLATFLSGHPYVTMMPRGQDLGSEPMSKWSKPSVVVMSESNYSDAHMFPYAYKALNIGKLVGMPVPGTATAVWWERLHTGDLIFGIPQVGVVTNDGDYLENNQLEPDIKVPNEPGVVSKGRDQQLEAAVKELLEQLEKARP